MSTTGNLTNTVEDTTDNGNEVVYTAVFIVLFLPPLVMLLVQLQRSISYGLHRKFFEKLLWVKFSDASLEKRINIHFLLKASFTFICLIRIVQAFVFLGVVLSPGPNLGMDNAIRYWIPYIAMNFMFTCISFLFYYWAELGLVSYGQIGKVRLVPLKFTWGFVIINVIFHILTIVILPIYIKPSIDFTTPTGNESAKTFRQIYLYAVNVPQLILCILGSVFVKYTMQRLKRKINMTDDFKSTIGKAYRRVEIFTAITAVVFALRIILNSIGIYVSVSGNVDFEATLEFFWNSIPEVSLAYAIAWLLWIKRSHVRASAYKSLPQDVASLLAPELAELEDDKDGVALPEVKA